MPRPKNVKVGEIFVQTPIKIRDKNEILLSVPFNNTNGNREIHLFTVFWNEKTGKPEIREGIS